MGHLERLELVDSQDQQVIRVYQGQLDPLGERGLKDPQDLRDHPDLKDQADKPDQLGP